MMNLPAYKTTLIKDKHFFKAATMTIPNKSQMVMNVYEGLWDDGEDC